MKPIHNIIYTLQVCYDVVFVFALVRFVNQSIYDSDGYISRLYMFEILTFCIQFLVAVHHKLLSFCNFSIHYYIILILLPFIQ